ncbi:MAG: glycerol-3-phosphate 1-O-acyltransferase PlsY [Myxococcota bacterium]
MVAWFVLTYLIAAIPFGLVLTTLYGGDSDIRGSGSGNIGATNVARVYGWRLAVPALLLDIAKGFFPVLGASLLWPELGLWWPAFIAFAAFLAHCFSVYLEFRGGKGVATGAGGMLALAPVPTLLAVGVWLVVLAITGKSSVGALLAAASLIGFAGWLDPQTLPVVVLLALGIGFTHVSNIRRLMRGQEGQVVRPVRWGRSASEGPDPEALLEQGPAGTPVIPALWKESVPDPLEITDDVTLESREPAEPRG